jgi:4-azaleucine resistance transporter AzlC
VRARPTGTAVCTDRRPLGSRPSRFVEPTPFAGRSARERGWTGRPRAPGSFRHTPCVRRGLRIAAPLIPAAGALGASFGVLARTAHLGALAAVVMSATTFAGSAQVAAVSVLGAGGGAAAAVVAALLLNARYAPIGITVAHAFHGNTLRRLLESQLVVDESWALSGGGTPRFDRRVLLAIGGALYVAWVAGTAIGALAGQAIGDPSAFGLDGAFAALFTALLAAQLRDRPPIAAAAIGGTIAAALIPVTAPGVPIIAATAAVLLGLRRA